jgi:acyl-homoserine lactone acylase PvdQ
VALADVLSWDQALASDSTGGLKYTYWREQLLADHGMNTVAEMAGGIDDWYGAVRGHVQAIDVSPDELESMVSSFAKAMDRLEKNHGSLDATYGDRFRVGRDEVSWPVGGGGRNGTTTLRNVGYTSERDNKTRWGRGGQTATQVVVLSDPPRSWITIPLGQSDRPDSPHYDDQAEKLFSRRTLKPSWWLPEELKDHIESRVELNRKEN